MRELSMHILDIVQNSLRAGADEIKIEISEQLKENKLVIKIEDNGCGMEAEESRAALDPFVTSRNTREVGMGLSLFQSAAKACNGNLKLESTPGEGTLVMVEFEYDHIDRAPLGDMPGTIKTILALNPEIRLIYSHQKEDNKFRFDSKEIKQELAGVSIAETRILNWLEQYIAEELEKLA